MDASTPSKTSGKGNLALLLKASAQWLLTVTVYMGAGTLVSWVCFAMFVGDPWFKLEANPAARAGGIGAVIALLAWLLMPSGFISALYVLVFPAGFTVLGHTLGLRVAVGRLVHEKVSAGPLSGLVDLLWPAVTKLAEVPGAEPAQRVLQKLLAPAAGGGLRRRILRFGLTYAKVPELLATSEFAARVRTEPEQARRDLLARLEERLADLTHTPRWRTLGLLLGGVIALTATRSFWLSWLGVVQ